MCSATYGHSTVLAAQAEDWIVRTNGRCEQYTPLLLFLLRVRVVIIPWGSRPTISANMAENMASTYVKNSPIICPLQWACALLFPPVQAYIEKKEKIITDIGADRGVNYNKNNTKSSFQLYLLRGIARKQSRHSIHLTVHWHW